MAKLTKAKSPLQRLSSAVKDVASAKLPPIPRYPTKGSGGKKAPKSQKMR